MEAPFSGVPSTCTRVSHTTPGTDPCDTQTRGCYKVPPSRDQTFPEPPSPCLQSGLRGVRVQEFVNNVLGRHLSSQLLWMRGGGAAPGEDPWQPLSEQPGPAPGTLDSGALAAQAWLLQPPSPPPSLPAGGCQGVRHGSRLACCLIYARQGRSADSRGAEGKPGPGSEVLGGPVAPGVAERAPGFRINSLTLLGPRNTQPPQISGEQISIPSPSHPPALRDLAIKGARLRLPFHWASPKRAFRKISSVLLWDIGCGLSGQRENT